MNKVKLEHCNDKRESIDSDFYTLAYEDYKNFMGAVDLAATKRQKQLLAAQTVYGHAINGDVGFARNGSNLVTHTSYPNTTISDIYRAILKREPNFTPVLKDMKKGKVDNRQPTIDEKLGDTLLERHLLFQEVKNWVIEAAQFVINRRTPKVYNMRRLQDKDRKPLMGIELFNHWPDIKNPLSVVMGIYLGGHLDNEYWREQAEDWFRKEYGINFTMHRGLCTAGNFDRIREANLTIADLSRLATNEITGHTFNSLLKDEIIVDFKKLSKEIRRIGVPNAKPFIPVYVELQKGYGVSDDAAFNYISLMYGIEAGFGFILADAIDTIDKCVRYIKEGGEDESLSNTVEGLFRKRGGIESNLGISKQAILNLIFASAIDCNDPRPWPSCSQRRFLQYDEKGNYALRNHVAYIDHICNGGPFPEDIDLSISHVSSRRFYEAFKKRIAFMLQKDIMSFNGTDTKKRDYFLDK